MAHPIPRESLHRIVDDSPTLDDSAMGYWPRESQTSWDREQADTPPYSAESMTAVAAIGWTLLWIATIAVACGGAAWAGMALMEWMEPHWPALVSMVTP